MTTRIAALTHLAFPLVGLLALTGACKSDGGAPAPGAGGSGGHHSGGAGGGLGGSNSGGSAGAGTGGSAVGQSGSGGSPPGGSGGKAEGSGGAAGTTLASGGIVGRDGAAGGAGGGGSGGQGGRPASDAGQGDARSIDGGPVACDDIESPARLAVYAYDDSAVSGSSIQLHFDIVNFTAFTSRLTQVTVRYWFTDEDAASANVVEQYYVPITTKMKFVTLNPPREGADTVLELSFPDTPDSGISWVETRGFNFAFHKTSYAGTYDQSNDYSYDPNLTKSLGQNPKITAYVDGALAWGCEPPVQAIGLDSGASGASEDPPDANQHPVDAAAE